MNAREALQLLRKVWGAPNVLGAHDAERLAAHATGTEMPLYTCARLAGVDLTGVRPFDHDAIRNLCVRREVELARGAP